MADLSDRKVSLRVSTEATIHGYNIEYLVLIATILMKEGLPPERVAEALTDIGRIVAIVTDEFEESLRKAVQNIEWKTEAWIDGCMK